VTLRLVDVIVLFVYLTGIVAFGSWFVRKSRSRRQFMAAGGALPAWAVGLSIFGTYVSSNSFVGAPGQSFRGNWNFFVFGLSLFPAAWIATRWFVPFYRTKGYISAYEHLEERFGPWARVYAVVIFLLLHITRSGTIMFGVSLAMSVLTGWPIKTIIIVAGIAVTLYTVLGGIEAVIWTDVVQSLILIGGLVLVSLLLLFTIDGGPSQLFATAAAHHKFSWGSWSLTDYAHSTVWVVFLYGMGVNLTRFGIDQTFIQRYHAAKSEAAAR
jgi:SSS family solute:Na+ symporter